MRTDLHIPKPLRIAILSHSTNPRGGVVHALELAEALANLGHEPVVHAPDVTGQGFFRTTSFETVSVPATKTSHNLRQMVETRVADYLRHFDQPAHGRFDIFHAHDGISGNALASLKDMGRIKTFARTVHHIDSFPDPAMMVLQRRAILAASAHAVVSETWKTRLEQDYALRPFNIGNGVNLTRYSPRDSGDEGKLRVRLGLRNGPVILSIGGVEERKNSVRLLNAFAQMRQIHTGAQLVIAGGASLLDHQAYHAEFQALLTSSNLPRGAVILTGALSDEDMPLLYRSADLLAFPSVIEGFGLVVLEAMACGLPVLTSRIAPFTEYLKDEDVVWCDPLNTTSIADGLMVAMQPTLRNRLMLRGAAVAARHSWARTAEAHLPLYAQLKEHAHA